MPARAWWSGSVLAVVVAAAGGTSFLIRTPPSVAHLGPLEALTRGFLAAYGVAFLVVAAGLAAAWWPARRGRYRPARVAHAAAFGVYVTYAAAILAGAVLARTPWSAGAHVAGVAGGHLLLAWLAPASRVVVDPGGD